MSKLTMLTAYDFNTARALEESGLDYILVGDSLANVFLGYKTTQEVSLDEMLMCTRAVKRGALNTKIIGDLPYVSVSKGVNGAYEDSLKFFEAGVYALKIENAEQESLELISKLVNSGYKILGHIGYTPQSVEKFSTQRKLTTDVELLLSEAKTLEENGVIGLVLEMVPEAIAKLITDTIKPFTIGIGAGSYTTGQVLVTDDLLGRFNLFKPKFVKRYAHQYEDMLNAFKSYVSEVQSTQFPAVEQILA
jgi:3-methyl-2-oxobutanoate hydroxymethyltransferase